MSTPFRLMLLLAVLSLLDGCASGVLIGAGQSSPQSSARSADQRLAAAVTRALVEAPDVPAMGIHVSADSGIVTLSGRVPTRGAVGRAITVARSVPGVRAVRSTLQIGN